MRRILLAVLVTLGACGGEVETRTTTPEGPAPGAAVDLNALIGAAPGIFAWGVVAAPENSDAFAAGFSVSPAGLMTAPDCRYTQAPPSGLPRAWPFVATVTATRNAVVEFQIAVTVDERFISSRVVCAIVTGETLCRDPALPLPPIGVGESVQFFTLTKATCTSTYTPPLPAGACTPAPPAPATDPFAFCK